MTEANGGRAEDLTRIEQALAEAGRVLEAYTPGEIEVRRKAGGDPVTEADDAVDDVLKRLLPRPGEGWLSEETVDDPSRLDCRRCWIVDPLDGTKEFTLGIPEWCVSVGLVEDGRAVAGGILVPATDQLFLGSIETGVTLNGRPTTASARTSLDGATVLASRSEFNRGEWERFADASFEVEPTGSVAYKLAQVAGGLADATWTLVPKNEWDVVGGVALVTAAGGGAYLLGETASPRFNRPDPLLPGLVAYPRGLEQPIRQLLGHG